jgi:ferredoxin
MGDIFMIRKIIKIDESKCNGCGLCVSACHEGAIGLIGGKAKLLRDDYCDGLGNCLPVCPTGAIAFEEREAAEYDEVAGKANMEKKQPLACGCPGTHSKPIERENCCKEAHEQAAGTETHLNQWPVQIKLVPPNASYFKNANLLVAADCTAYAYGNFHREYMKNKITIIGCPKLDEGDYTEKLAAILKMNDIKSVTVVRMEVPCCSGIENAVKNALKISGRFIPWQVVIISTDGVILEN